MSALAVAQHSALGRRNPTVKLALLTAVSFVLLVVLDPVTPAVLYVLALVGIAGSARVRTRTLALAQLPAVSFAVGVLVVNAVSRPGTAAVVLGPLVATSEGLAVGSALAARTLLIGLLAVGFVLSTDGVALMTSLHSQARLDARLTYAVLAGHRMLQEMPREWTTIRHAHAVRAPLRSSGGTGGSGGSGGSAWSGRARWFAGAAFALLVVSVRKGDRLARSLESRGLGLQPRTVWRPTRTTRADWWLVCVVLGVLAAALAAAVVTGVARGPSALLT